MSQGRKPETWTTLVTISSGVNIFKASNAYCQIILQNGVSVYPFTCETDQDLFE